jgi:hypothetical protein
LYGRDVVALAFQQGAVGRGQVGVVLDDQNGQLPWRGVGGPRAAWLRSVGEGERQQRGERGAGPRSVAVRADPAAVEFDDRPGHRQPETEALGGVRSGGRRPHEDSEQLLGLTRREADPIVLDGQPHLPVRGPRRGRRLRRRQPYPRTAARHRVLERVGQQIGQHLGQSQPVPVDQHRVGGQVDVEGAVLVAEQAADVGTGAVHDGAQVRPLAHQLQAAGHGPCPVEQVVAHPHQRAELPFQHRQRRMAVRQVERE